MQYFILNPQSNHIFPSIKLLGGIQINTAVVLVGIGTRIGISATATAGGLAVLALNQLPLLLGAAVVWRDVGLADTLVADKGAVGNGLEGDAVASGDVL